MLDFIVLIVILWVLNLSSNKKKKNAENTGAQRSKAVRTEKTPRKQRVHEANRQKPGTADPVPKKTNASERLVSQIEMELAAQKAHERTMMPKKAEEKRSIVLPKKEDSEAENPILGGETAQNRRKQQLAQDMLRGVVMSEILMRPSERAAIQKMRRSR